MTNTTPITIFDTTLRDGEQSPGMSMTVEEKLAVAEVLDTMDVNVIEAGFAMSSQGDFDSIKAISERSRQSVICSLARGKAADIERAAEALKPAITKGRGRIHTFISTSDIHLEYQFKKSREEILEIIKETVSKARNYTDNVEWSAMDATRSDMGYLTQAVEAAIEAGATTINLPDTVGYGTPESVADMFRTVMGNAKNADQAIFSFHGQNDLGLATANTLAAIAAGARQAEVTINGIGERAGNTSMEEVIMALKLHGEQYGVSHSIDTTQLIRASRLVQSITGQSVQVNKAIVGANAFAHESGIHQDGMLKNRDTYEIMTPESVGLTKSDLVMGKHSGRAAFKDKLAELGIALGDNALEDAFGRFKDLADKKKQVYDADILTLIGEEYAPNQPITFEALEIECGTTGPQIARLTLGLDGKVRTIKKEGNGPVDAIFRAIRGLAVEAEDVHLQLYQVHAVTQGTDAQAEVTVRLEKDGLIANGHGADVDTLVASAKAYIDGVCALERQAEKEIKSLVE